MGAGTIWGVPPEASSSMECLLQHSFPVMMEWGILKSFAKTHFLPVVASMRCYLHPIACYCNNYLWNAPRKATQERDGLYQLTIPGHSTGAWDSWWQGRHPQSRCRKQRMFAGTQPVYPHLSRIPCLEKDAIYSGRILPPRLMWSNTCPADKACGQFDAGHLPLRLPGDSGLCILSWRWRGNSCSISGLVS